MKNMSLFELRDYHKKVSASMDPERAHSISDMILVELVKRLATGDNAHIVLEIVEDREKYSEGWWWA